MDSVAVFCDVDDFYRSFEPWGQQRLLAEGTRQRLREQTLALSAGMTVVITFRSSGYRTFKDFYTKDVTKHLQGTFPPLVSSNHFVGLMQSTLLPLCAYLQTRKGMSGGVAFPLCRPCVCLNARPGIRFSRLWQLGARVCWDGVTDLNSPCLSMTSGTYWPSLSPLQYPWPQAGILTRART